MRPPIHSVKHYVGQTITSVLSATMLNIEVINAVIAPAAANANEVPEGSVIKAVYIEMWTLNDAASGVAASFNFTLERSTIDIPDMTLAEALNLTAYTNKKNVLYVTQGALAAAKDGGASIPMMRQWFKIPKGKQRFGLGDQLKLNLASLANNIDICGIFVYKAYL